MTPRLEAVPDDDGAEPPRRVRARGVSASLTWVSALVVLVLLGLLVLAVVMLITYL